MDGAGEMFGSFEFAFYERLVDDHFGGYIGKFSSLPSFYLLAHRFEVALHPVDTDRDTIDQRKRFRVLGEHRRKYDWNNVAKLEPQIGCERASRRSERKLGPHIPKTVRDRQ